MSTEDPIVKDAEEVPEVSVDNIEEVDADKHDSDSEDAMKKEHHVLDRFPMRSTTITLPGGHGEIYFNHVTSFVGFAILWGLSIWCMADEEGSLEVLKDWQAAVTEKFTWFYIVSNPAFTFFIFYLAYRYGDVKLGKPDEEPEFSDQAYFMMLFSAGVAVGLFFFGVSEPLSHRTLNWYAESEGKSQDEVDQWALALTVYHWGFAGWSPYLVVAIACGIPAYRYDMPMTIRTGLYEILGEYTWGWIGDIIDGFSMVTTVAGICTSLGLGAMQVLEGATRLGWVEENLTEDEEKKKNVTIIWVITAAATISVVTGLKVGIKLLSQIGFGLGMVLLFLVLVMEKTNFLFNLLVQTMGYFFQHMIFLVPFWTDAFGQLVPGEGRAIDDEAAHPSWQNWWTVFYMSWWTAWGAFVGLFIARISRGRTIRSIVTYSFMAPLFYSFLWFTTFGGTALRQARQAEELEKLGTDFFGDPTKFRVPGSDYCYNVPQEDYVLANGTTIFTNNLIGITPVCQYSGSATGSWFNVMYSFEFPDKDGSFGGFGGFMAGLSLFAVAIYFVTSSDSGSLVVDHLASNGHEEHHWLQRVFWAFTEGAVATALLVAGGNEALDALQAASIVFGLPFNVFIYGMMVCTIRSCTMYENDVKNGTQLERKDIPLPEDNAFAMPLWGGIFNIMEMIVSFGSVHPERVERGMDMPTGFQVTEFFIALFLPFVSLYRILTKMEYSSIEKILFTVTCAFLHVAWIGLFIGAYKNMGFVAFGFTCFLSNGIVLTVIRSQVREAFSLEGNVVGDYTAGSFLYPQALVQMLYQFEVKGEKED